MLYDKIHVYPLGIDIIHGEVEIACVQQAADLVIDQFSQLVRVQRATDRPPNFVYGR